MSEVSTIMASHKAVAEGPAWHGGPAVLDILSGVTADRAAARPVPVCHSIWEILLHMTRWQEYGVRVLSGQQVGEITPEEDWPAVTDTSQAAWKMVLAAFKKSNQRFRELVSEYDPPSLSQRVPGQEYPLKVLLHGMAQHNVYHLGQIALLKKVLESSAQ